MKKLLFIFLFSPLFASDPTSVIDRDEIEIIQELVKVTQQKLTSHEKLLQQVIQFKKIRMQFIADPNSRKLATALVRSAEKINAEIQLQQLYYLFNEQFLKEIRFFAQVGQQAAAQSLSS